MSGRPPKVSLLRQFGILASRFSTGPHTVEVRVFTSDGKVTPLGRRTINIDNTPDGANQAPFGNLDIPDLSGTYDANGSFPVVGWAADTDGIARIDVTSDGSILQQAIYGDARPDVGNTFPDFPAALFSGFIANIDSTRLKDAPSNEFDIACAQHCGTAHYKMKGKLTAYTKEEFAAWAKEASATRDSASTLKLL